MKPLWINPSLNIVTQTVADHQTGPDWIAVVVIIIFLMLSILLLSGRGSFLIAGYNTASKREKSKFDEKRLCRVMGSGLGLITLSMMVLLFFDDSLSEWWIGFQVLFVIVIVIIMIVLANTWCKKK